ncbi:MAG TPA: hypothetical protein DEF41_14170 [Desulfovibrio sp.]|uniref:Uncharacterized protein n=1 Tax=Nitratidesulfovibrio vulgaris (strain ATCC 29579 / DSM 644 / CCUG 34227 / NCIMB 8303 / VKM B-1760 / Hildenborough) TaxID=882 RepID=Q72CQ7_NITV2|nr:hypothetical protein DVU_1226 [Nitratidesulfovibrio vulgaris str. Hildenborough]HBW17232.1 hypothetical protein [Desulfovibrio sp.]
MLGGGRYCKAAPEAILDEGTMCALALVVRWK